MKSIAFKTILAPVTVCLMVFTATVAFATTIVPIEGRYSKIRLSGICSAEGGMSYGTSTSGYGCTKGNNTVECDKDGKCTGYIGLRVQTGGKDVTGVMSAVLQSLDEPVKPGVKNDETVDAVPSPGAVIRKR